MRLKATKAMALYRDSLSSTAACALTQALAYHITQGKELTTKERNQIHDINARLQKGVNGLLAMLADTHF